MSRVYKQVYGLPPGRYYVGDPCYAVPNDDWDEVLEETGYLGLFVPGTHDYKPDDERFTMFEVCEGGRVWHIGACGTAYGDGEYYDEEGRAYPVDAGLIGLVSANYADIEGNGNRGDCGHMVTFSRNISIGWEEDEGTIVIGPINIKTNPTEEGCYYCGDRWCDEECQQEDDDED